MKNPLCLALDVDDSEQALRIASELKNQVGVIKLGPRLTNRDSQLVKKISVYAPVFVDHKYYDIPSTMEAAVRSAFESGASFVTIHASAGKTALKLLSSVEAELNKIRPFSLLAVTILTSFTQEDLPNFLQTKKIKEQVSELAELCFECGIFGIVCSPEEISQVREKNSQAFIVAPGIRPANSPTDDQKRTLTARQALELGANLLVVGRPILKAANKSEAVHNLLKEIQFE